MKYKVLFIISFIVNLCLILFCIFLIVNPFVVKTPNEIFKKSIDSIVEVKASKDYVGESYGSGVVYSKDGDIITNAHILTYRANGENKFFDNLEIRFHDDSEYLSAELVKVDIEKDLALLKYETSNNMRSICVSDSTYSYGDLVYAIGNTSNYGIGISQGIISVPEVNIVFEGLSHVMIQADINIASGNSGGALLDSDGKLIGITTFRTKDLNGNVNYGFVYSIPIKIILNFVRRV